MALLETLTINLGAALSKAVFKLWLHDDSPVAVGAADGLIDGLKKHIGDFETRFATERLFLQLSAEVAKRLKTTIEIEFPQLPENDRDAAVLAVASVFEELDLSRGIMSADLDALGLETVAKPVAAPKFRDLGGKAQQLAELVLRESCAYAVTLAGKLPNFQVAATRELLKRTTELISDLAQVLDAVAAMRSGVSHASEDASFETRYRRALAQKLDRLQLFGLRLVGAGAREYGLSVAYVTLSSALGGATKLSDVDACMSDVRRVVVRGEAGSGKTTLLQWLAVRAARRDFSGELEAWNGLTPFFVRLRDYTNRPLPPPERLLECVTPNLTGIMPERWAHQALVERALLIVDGVDELPATRRDDLFEWLRGIVDDFPGVLCIVSSRPAALDAERNQETFARRLAKLNFQPLTLEPMTLQDSEALVARWHLAVGRDLTGEEGLAKLERYERELRRALRDRPAIRNLASNPLLCSMICALNWDRQQRLPDDRMELYRLALEMLVESRDAERKIEGTRLATLDRRAKEEILDQLAYWMLRNGHSEANRTDVVVQVESALRRLAGVPNDAEEVVQELLERSGVLRQPQSGMVDFIHRTFLEYMAARAAISSGDLGLLVDKAREEGWRETIVFAAGHAKGVVRDKLIAELLKKPLLSFLVQSAEIDVTAVCCLETVSANLAPDLLLRLRERATSLFPPQDFAAARFLAPAAAMDPALLIGHRAAGAAAVAACIRCASIVGGARMLDVVETYVDEPGTTVENELLSASTAFDEESYLQRIICKRQWLGFLSLQFDLDTARCLQFLVRKGVHHKSRSDLTAALNRFVSSSMLVIREMEFENYEGVGPSEKYLARRNGRDPSSRTAGEGDRRVSLPVTVADAKRIAAILSLRTLVLGPTEPGVLAMIAKLPDLTDLRCYMSEPSEITALAESPALQMLTLSGYPCSRAPKGQTVDLRPLDNVARLRDLAIEFMDDCSIQLPVGANLRVLKLTHVPPTLVAHLESFQQLEELHLQLLNVPNRMLNLLALPKLKLLSVDIDESFVLELPSSITDLHIYSARAVEVHNADKLIALKELRLLDIEGMVIGSEALVDQPTLKQIWLCNSDVAIHPRRLERAKQRGVEINTTRGALC